MGLLKKVLEENKMKKLIALLLVLTLALSMAACGAKKTGDAAALEGTMEENINKIIVDYFAMTNQKLGSTINISEITKKILDLNYIESIETKYIPKDNSSDIVTINSLSFASYTPAIITRSRF